jgi:hypothetical protein
MMIPIVRTRPLPRSGIVPVCALLVIGSTPAKRSAAQR